MADDEDSENVFANNTQRIAPMGNQLSCRCPEAWFIQADSQFASKGVTQNTTKYEFMLTALPYEVIMSVFDYVQNAATNNMYEVVKKFELRDTPSANSGEKILQTFSEYTEY
uniref:DUF7041 domain-containing protein n=1 Tax=Glossina pallidipes TaxID=7398 RepID=A0A1A9ZVB6_GLOPL